jgi:hypothetical protein
MVMMGRSNDDGDKMMMMGTKWKQNDEGEMVMGRNEEAKQ